MLNHGIRIAILGPISWRTPPRQYGAWETVVTNLSEGLIARGFDVTLFATGDSITQGTLHAVSPQSWEENASLDPKVWEALHISEVMDRTAEFDLIHNNFDFLPLTYSRLIKIPMLTTVHGFSLDQYRLVYRKYRRSFFVSISNADRDAYLRYVATVYNGIQLNNFTYNGAPSDYLAFVGRVHPDKGVHHAIKVAREAGRKLIIAGIVQDQQYFDECIEPELDDQITFVGPVGPLERDEIFRNAYASLHLTTIPERFGLAMAESMACGTPVIGFDRGSVREVVADGETGFVVTSEEGAVDAVSQAERLDRQACRSRVETLFSVDAMVTGYVNVYRQIFDEQGR